MFSEDSTSATSKAQPLKRYLGDGVYADFDGYALVLTTENGIETTNIVVLEPQVYTALLDYVKDLSGGTR